jgi:hypothetical protein
VFALVKTAVDRYGMKAVRKVLDGPAPGGGRRART